MNLLFVWLLLGVSVTADRVHFEDDYVVSEKIRVLERLREFPMGARIDLSQIEESVPEPRRFFRNPAQLKQYVNSVAKIRNASILAFSNSRRLPRVREAMFERVYGKAACRFLDKVVDRRGSSCPTRLTDSEWREFIDRIIRDL